MCDVRSGFLSLGTINCFLLSWLPDVIKSLKRNLKIITYLFLIVSSHCSTWGMFSISHIYIQPELITHSSPHHPLPPALPRNDSLQRMNRWPKWVHVTFLSGLITILWARGCPPPCGRVLCDQGGWYWILALSQGTFHNDALAGPGPTSSWPVSKRGWCRVFCNYTGDRNLLFHLGLVCAVLSPVYSPGPLGIRLLDLTGKGWDRWPVAVAVHRAEEGSQHEVRFSLEPCHSEPDQASTLGGADSVSSFPACRWLDLG